MFKLPVRTWILNAAAVFSGQHGDVTRQAEQSECSRETVYQHARKVEQPARRRARRRRGGRTRAENRRLREEIAGLRRDAVGLVRCDKASATPAGDDRLRHGGEPAADRGSPRRPPARRRGPRPFDLGALGPGRGPARRRGPEGPRPGVCRLACSTLALDEIFFGGDRPWSGSSRRA